MDPLALTRETGSRLVGRYLVHRRIAAGGMATVHLGRLLGAAGFSRTVAIKRLHDGYARDPEFVAMLLDEARLASQIRHPNVVPTLDVVAEQDELLVVMEYVTGDSLAHLGKLVHLRHERFPVAIAATVVAQALHGLHAAHEARDKNGEPLGIVHRDVSPQNVLVGTDGVARVLDFGIAKAASRATSTEDGQIKGKTAYMAPEQLQQNAVDRRTDVWAAGVMLWELLTGKRLFLADSPAGTIGRVLHEPIDPPTRYAPDCPPELTMICMRALERDPGHRFQTAEEMAHEIEDAVMPPRPKEIGAWVSAIAASTLESRAELVREVESEDAPPPSHSTTDPALRAALEEAERRRNLADLPTDMGRGPQYVEGQQTGPLPPSPVTTGRRQALTRPESSSRSGATPITNVIPNPMSSRPGVAPWVTNEVTDLATVTSGSNYVAQQPQGISRLSILLGMFGGVLLAFLVAIGILFARGRFTVAKQPEPPASMTVAEPVPVPAPSPAPIPTPSQVALELPAPAPQPSATVKKGTGKPTWHPPASPVVKKPDCTIPFTVDLHGEHHIRPECS